MRRTKKLNSKNSKSKRANKKKNVRISKKKVGGGVRKSMTPGRRIPGTLALPRHLPFERAGKAGVKPEGFLERKERERRERERERRERERRERERRERIDFIKKNTEEEFLAVKGRFVVSNPRINVETDQNFKKAETALKELVYVVLNYQISDDPGKLWIEFLMSLQFKVVIGSINLNFIVLEYFRQLIYLLHPLFKEEIILFLRGPAQTSDWFSFSDAGFIWYKHGDEKLFPTWLLEKLLNPQRPFVPTVVHSSSLRHKNQ
jgi:hypothetical protein